MGASFVLGAQKKNIKIKIINCKLQSDKFIILGKKS